MEYRTSLLLLLLGILTECVSGWTIKNASKLIIQQSSDQEYVMASESPYENHLVFAKFAKIQNPRDHFKVGVEIISESKSLKCSLNFEPIVDANYRGVSTIKRINDARVLLTTFDEFQSGERKFSLTLLDLKNCKQISPLSKYLPASHIIFSSDKNLDIVMIIVISKKFCRPRNTCILTFNHDHAFLEHLAFDINLVRNIRIKPLSVSNNTQKFIVSGYDVYNNYKIQTYDTTNSPPTIEESTTAEQHTTQQVGYDLDELILSPCNDTSNFEIYLCIISLSLVLYIIVNGLFVGFKRINKLSTL